MPHKIPPKLDPFDPAEVARQTLEWQRQCHALPAPPTRTGIFETWYNDPNIPEPWSTDWDDWEGIARYILSTTHDDKRDKVEKLIEVFELPGKIEPLAFIPDIGGDAFLFASGGQFYMWTHGELMAHRMAFASPEEFLKHALQPRIGDKTNLPDMQLLPTSGPEDIYWIGESNPARVAENCVLEMTNYYVGNRTPSRRDALNHTNYIVPTRIPNTTGLNLHDSVHTEWTIFALRDRGKEGDKRLPKKPVEHLNAPAGNRTPSRRDTGGELTVYGSDAWSQTQPVLPSSQGLNSGSARSGVDCHFYTGPQLRVSQDLKIGEKDVRNEQSLNAPGGIEPQIAGQKGYQDARNPTKTRYPAGVYPPRRRVPMGHYLRAIMTFPANTNTRPVLTLFTRHSFPMFRATDSSGSPNRSAALAASPSASARERGIADEPGVLCAECVAGVQGVAGALIESRWLDGGAIVVWQHMLLGPGARGTGPASSTARRASPSSRWTSPDAHV
ncbi:hypothetical protein DFH06DRAFT_1396822 [Mycena polygramma]|nr:hypothetical protein DFH06DRAFT_1396822 [Mycena polygramma]